MDELNRRQFVTQLAKTCLGVGMLPLTQNYMHADQLKTSRVMAKANM